MRILLVEDESNLAEALVQILERNDYEADSVGDGKAGLHAALSGLYDCILLDVMLPKLTGFEVLKRLRKTDTETPVILLTARGDVSDRVMGLDYGADDYLPKPFNTDELLARIRAVARRVNGADEHASELRFGDVTLHPSRNLMTAGEHEVGLTEKETQLVQYLFHNETLMLSPEYFIQNVWSDEDATEETVQRYISFIQKKLEFLGTNVKILEIRGIGYKLLA